MELRTQMRPGDLGEIVRMHGAIYAREHGFDETFEAYVAGPLAEFVMRRHKRERIWIAEDGGRIAGCVAIVQAYPSEAQLRWFLVDPAARGQGLGSRLLTEAIEFCKSQKYHTIVLWTVHLLEGAARLYIQHGFRKVQQNRTTHWGVNVTDEKYMLDLPLPLKKK